MADKFVSFNRPITTGYIAEVKKPNVKPKSVDSPQQFDQIFQQVLNEKNQELKFSRHAQERIMTRQIQLSKDEMDKLENAVAAADKKGLKDTLIITNNMAFIVNVPNKTVITAVDGSSMKDNVFTNIDGAVIV